MECVFENDDLRRYIFSFLRKYPNKKCKYCGDVCVWDKRVKLYIELNSGILCTDCWFNSFNGTGCITS